jgi:CRP-like cAMP-binding protein
MSGKDQPATSSASSGLAESIRPFLRINTFFGGLPDTALDHLIGRGHTKRFAKGYTICRRGEPGDSLMVLLSGRVKVVNTTTDAKEVVLNVLGPGDLNGEIGALDGKGRTADAIALEACEIFTVNARDLLQTLAAHPAALLEIIQVLCEKLRSADPARVGPRHILVLELPGPPHPFVGLGGDRYGDRHRRRGRGHRE